MTPRQLGSCAARPSSRPDPRSVHSLGRDTRHPPSRRIEAQPDLPPSEGGRMRPELVALAASQGGLVTRRQAVHSGYTERELRTHTAVAGPWVVVRRGVYVDRGFWEALDSLGQWRLRD